MIDVTFPSVDTTLRAIKPESRLLLYQLSSELSHPASRALTIIDKWLILG